LQLERRRAADAPGAVDQDIHLAQLSDYVCQRRLERPPIGDVGTDAQCFAAPRLDFRRSGVDLLAPPRSWNHVGPSLRKPTRQRQTDARGAADYHRATAGKAQARQTHRALADRRAYQSFFRTSEVAELRVPSR